MMSYDNVATVAHQIEDLFFKIRENNSVGSEFSSVCDVVFEGGDFIKGQMEKIQNGEEASGSADKLVENISKLLGEISGATEPQTNEIIIEDKAESVQDQEGFVPKADSGKNKFAITIIFEEDCKMENVRAFSVVNSMNEYCSEIISKPKELFDNPTCNETIQKEGFVLFVSSDLSKQKVEELIKKQMCVKSIEVKQVDSYQDLVRNESNINQEVSDNKGKEATDNSKNNPLKPTAAKQSLINVNVDKLDALMDFVGEIVITGSMLEHNPLIKGIELPVLHKNIDRLQKLTKELQDVVMSVRMVPIAGVFHKMNRIVRDMSKELNKEVVLSISGEETEVDKTVIDNLSDPLMHLVRNSMDHGLESSEERIQMGKPAKGTVRLNAMNIGSNVIVTVSDDGRGLDRDKLIKKAIEKKLITGDEEISDKKAYSLILAPGFSTKEQVTKFSGRGVGMDVVRQNIESINGSISIDSEPGKGMITKIKIPLTLSIIEGMNVSVGDLSFILPITSIQESFRPKAQDIVTDPYGNEMILIRGKCCNVIRLHEKYGIDTEVKNLEEGILITVENNNKLVCMFVDKIIGDQQIVIKSLPKYLSGMLEEDCGIAGCTILGDGGIGFIINTNEL